MIITLPFSRAELSVAAWLRPEATRAKDVYYAFEKTDES